MTINDVGEKIMQLTRQLLPTGRAFRIPYGGVREAVERGLIKSEKQFHDDVVSILDSILPDNDNFTAYDATRWEQRLGLIANENLSLADRKSAILRKMNHPGDIIARQSADYIQAQLRLAGFDVYVHENLNQYSFEYIINLGLGAAEMGEAEMGEAEMISARAYYPELFSDVEMGGIEMGSFEMGEVVFTNLIVNYLEPEKDAYFNVGSNNSCTFFVGGETFGTFADVLSTRETEFRQLILKLKPTQTVCGALINYI